MAAGEVRVVVDGSEVHFTDAGPVLLQGRILVPLRVICSALGVREVGWDEATREVEVVTGGAVINMTVGEVRAYVGSREVLLDVPPRIMAGRTMVPLRFFSQALGATVDWDAETRTASIRRPRLGSRRLLGYYAFSSYPDLILYGHLLTDIATFWFSLEEDGGLRESYPQDFLSALREARRRNLGVTAIVFADEPAVLSGVLNDPARRQRAIDAIYRAAAAMRFDGVNLDFEGVRPEDRDAFTLFVLDLNSKLKGLNMSLSLSLPAKSSDGQSWLAGYDFSRLGRAADFVVIMAYNQHYKTSAPGPIAGYPWAERVVKYAVSKIDPAKVLLGLGVYGYDWASGAKTQSLVTTVAYERAERYGAQVVWDETERSPHYEYVDEYGRRHQVWFEDERSIAAKMELVDKYGLGGIALWRLGYPDADTWRVIAGGTR